MFDDPNNPEKKLPRFFSFSAGTAESTPPAALGGLNTVDAAADGATDGATDGAAVDDDAIDDDGIAEGCCKLDCIFFADADSTAA